MHAGQLQVLRELIDGRAGSDRDEHDDDWWRAYTERLEGIALGFRTGPVMTRPVRCSDDRDA